MLATVAFAQSPPACTGEVPFAEWTIAHVRGGTFPLTLDPAASPWTSSKPAVATIVKDCSHSLSYSTIETTVQGFWTDTDLYLLFRCPYRDLNLFLPAANDKARDKLWDRDVVEMFLGDDWTLGGHPKPAICGHLKTGH
ncbi:MAG TPA: hypothetical protein VGL53_19920 [Bryobacteraceae bacterium]